MTAERAVTFIPASTGRYASITTGISAKKRVAAYARVSTDTEEQLSSYEAQVDHYTKHIHSNPAWDFINVYADEGISATSTKKRNGFNKMIADALSGKIDLIITKSVSRFARNTVDTLTTVRQLKEKGVEVFFEKENIYTMDSKGELLITIMSSLAQEESRSISENVTWGHRKRFADGKLMLPYGRFLGYEKGEDGLPQIVEKEAVVVRLIYKLFLEGKTPTGIARHLTAEGILTPSGKDIWQSSTVENILKNEKFKGDALLQKTFTIDFLTKKKKANEGEIPQYYVENSHPAIIMPEVYDMVQQEFIKRKNVIGYKTGGSCFSGRIICGECGSFYGSKVWHSTSIYRRTIWQCNHKFKNDKKCQIPHLYEEDIKKSFVEVFNSLIKNKAEILQNYKAIIAALTDTSKLDNESAKLQSESKVVAEMLRKCVEENANTAIDQVEYNMRYRDLAEHQEAIKNKLIEINNKHQERNAKRENIDTFIQMLENSDTLLTEFDEELWNSTLDVVTIHSEHEIAFTFKDGMKVNSKI